MSLLYDTVHSCWSFSCGETERQAVVDAEELDSVGGTHRAAVAKPKYSIPVSQQITHARPSLSLVSRPLSCIFLTPL